MRGLRRDWYAAKAGPRASEPVMGRVHRAGHEGVKFKYPGAWWGGDCLQETGLKGKVDAFMLKVLTEFIWQTQTTCLPGFPRGHFYCTFPRICSSWVNLKSQAVRTMRLELIDWRTDSIDLTRSPKLIVKGSLAGARALVLVCVQACVLVCVCACVLVCLQAYGG